MELDPKNPIVQLHISELYIHQTLYQDAVTCLTDALYCLEMDNDISISRGLYNVPIRSQYCKSLLAANIYSLLGVAQFRANPTSPEIAMKILEKGVSKYPNAIFILLCQGEIYSQVGEIVKSIKCFQHAARIEEDIYHSANPLPYINAARAYQQLSEPIVALNHMLMALKYDSFLPMIFVDLAQIFLHTGKTKEAIESLNHGLIIARHCSEIRDVLTAQTIANIQLELEMNENIFRPKCHNNYS